MTGVRHTARDYHELAFLRGFVWVEETTFPSVTRKTEWKCKYGHFWKATFTKIKQGRGCPYCSNRVPKNGQDYRALALSHGFAWSASECPLTTAIKTTWRCNNGHEWSASFNNIRRWGCPYCAGEHVPKTSEDYHRLAHQRDFEWIDPMFPLTTHLKTLWRCSVGHEWQAKYPSINRGDGCPYCADVARKNAGDYAKLANESGLIWLGPVVKSVTRHTGWQCANGHHWSTSYRSIAKGSGCPLCLGMINGVRVSKPQLELHEMLGGELNFRVMRYSLDIALTIDGQCIAIEYDCWHWHRDMLDHDEKRDKSLIAQGWHILRIKSSKLLPTRTQLNDAISQLVNGATYAEIVLSDWRE